MCDSLTIKQINNQVLNKIKIAVRLSSQKGHKYDQSMINVWLMYDNVWLMYD